MQIQLCDIRSVNRAGTSGDAIAARAASRGWLAAPTANWACTERAGTSGRRACAHLFGTVLIAIVLNGCASVIPGADYPKRASVALLHPEDTKLARQFADSASSHTGASGFRILSVGTDGFAIRIQLIAAAERSLDLQYFIFRGDKTGQLLADALLRAADRGVHVRLLIDDAARTRGDEPVLALATHPQVELRLFNPLAYRGRVGLLQSAEFGLHSPRLDFRMHNKLLVADNATALIGGRNVGDSYFQMDPAEQFADDDVFVVGPTVQALSKTFDEYWNSDFAIPIEALTRNKPGETALVEERRQLAERRQQAQQENSPYYTRAESGEPFNGIAAGRTPLVWSAAQVVCDSPSKKRVVNGAIAGRLMYEPVAKVAADSTSEVVVITPYLIPTPAEVALLKGLRERDVRVRILTNSLESTGELSAHSGYVRFRRPLVEDGVELHELRALLGNTRGSGQTAAISRFGNYGLHGKLFVFDRRKLFIGSMNFDQRSMNLNTEIGLIIDSPELAEQTATRFEAMTQPANAYLLALRPQAHGKPRLVWRTQEAGKDVEYVREPSRSPWRRFAVRLLRLLPLDSEL
jgi:putative cardiolipin synthase